MFTVIKRNRRLIIIDSLDNTVYSIPNWIKISSRDQLQGLADCFNVAGCRCISSIIDWETRHHS